MQQLCYSCVGCDKLQSSVTSWDDPLQQRGDLVLKDSLTPTRGAGVRGVGGGGPGWGLALLLPKTGRIFAQNRRILIAEP